jgi:predicted XRE-type DNA-binding protein
MSSNVFADLELPKPDEHFLKASLLLAIADIMRKSGLTQMDIAQKSGLKQPEVSRIMSERWSGFSTDRLARIAFSLCYVPIIELRPMKNAGRSKTRPARKAQRSAA